MRELAEICRRGFIACTVMVWLLLPCASALAVPEISITSPLASQHYNTSSWAPSFTCSDSGSSCATGWDSCQYSHVHPDLPDIFASPSSLTSDGTYIYVADTGNSRIVKRLASDLSFVASIGSYGDGNNEFSYPPGVASDGTYLYVADAGNSRIVKRLASTLSFVASVGSFGSGNDEFNYPSGIISDGTYLYIADAFNNRIVKRLGSDLSFVAAVGSEGPGNDEFSYPTGITSDGTFVYVTDTWNNRIVKRLASDLSFVASIGSYGSGDDQFSMPYGITSDGTYLYIADAFNNRIVKRLASDLSFVASIGGSGSGNDEFNTPYGIISDGAYLYVADYGNSRIVKRLASDLSFVAKVGSYGYSPALLPNIDCSNDGTDIPQPDTKGRRTLYIRAKDGSGTWGSWASVNFTYGDPPVISIGAPSAANVYGPNTWSPSVTWENNGGGTCEYSFDNVTWSPVSCANGGSDIPAPGDGAHSLYIRETDEFSFSSTVDIGGAFSYEGVRPSVTVTSPVEGQTYGPSSWAPSFTCDDGAGSGCAAGWGSCQYSYNDPAMTNAFDEPEGIASDGTYLYVADTDNHRIVKRLASDLSFVASIGSNGSGNDEFSNPAGVASDGTYLYVADRGNSRIVKRLASDLSFVAAVGSDGSGNDQFSQPYGIASDGTYLYVADSGNDRIVKRLASDLSFVAAVGSEGSGNDQFNNPYGITSDGTYLYVGDDYNYRIVKRLASDLSFVASIGSYGTGNDEFKTTRSIASDGTYLYVADPYAYRIIKRRASDLSFVAAIGSYGSGNNQFDDPFGITSDGTYLYVADTDNNRIVKRLASDLSFVASVGREGSVSYRYSGVDCALMGSDIPPPTHGSATLYVRAQDLAGNWSEPRLIQFTYDATPPSVTITSPVEGQTYGPHSWAPSFTCSDGIGSSCATGAGSCQYSYIDPRFPDAFNGPVSSTFDGTYLYVADNGNHRIVKRLASDLSFVASVGSVGSGNDQFTAPFGITSDGTYIYIVDNNNHRIVKRLATDLSFVASVGSAGSGNDQFAYPTGITSDGTYIYIVDNNNHRIVKRLASDLSFVASVGSFGSGDSQFFSPLGITGDGTYLYVADSYNHRLVKLLASDLSFVAAIGSNGTGNNEFNAPAGIASDGTHLYIADMLNHRIVKLLASDLSFVAAIGSNGTGNDEFSAPMGIASDGTHLYVAEMWNNRIVKRLSSDLSFVAKVGSYGDGDGTPQAYTGIDCANGGSDIPLPASDIPWKLYVRAQDVYGNWGDAAPVQFMYDSTLPPPTPTLTPTSTPIATPTSTPTAMPTSILTSTPTPLPTSGATLAPPPSLAIGVPPRSPGTNPVVISRQTTRLSGTGTPGHMIEVQVDGFVVGTALVTANSTLGARATTGVWEFELPPLATGTREIGTVSIDESGNRSAPSAAMKLVVLDVAPLDFAGSGDSAIAAFRRIGDKIRFRTRTASESGWSNFEMTGRYPAPADYDNDGITDLAAVGVVRGKLQWNIKLSSTGGMSTAALGDLGDTIISGCHFESDQGASLSTFRSDRRELVYRSYNGSTDRIVKLSKLSRGDLLGCGDTDGDGKDEILFRVRGGKKQSSSVAAFDTAGNRKVFAGYNKFLRGFVVRRTGTQVPLVAVLRGTTNNGRQVKITTMAGSFAFPMFYISRSATIGTGIFTNQTNDQIPGLFWADNRSGVVYRRLLTTDAQTNSLFNLPDGYTLIRSQNVIRTERSS